MKLEWTKHGSKEILELQTDEGKHVRNVGFVKLWFDFNTKFQTYHAYLGQPDTPSAVHVVSGRLPTCKEALVRLLQTAIKLSEEAKEAFKDCEG